MLTKEGKAPGKADEVEGRSFGLLPRERSSSVMRSFHQSARRPSVKKGREAPMMEDQGEEGFQEVGGAVVPWRISWRTRFHCSARISSSKQAIVGQSVRNSSARRLIA